jgi:hypothetical protein
MTRFRPEDHLANHKAGTKAAWVVKRYGLRLLPELYAHLNPMPYEAAAQMEKDLAEDLRRASNTVMRSASPARLIPLRLTFSTPRG